MFNKIYSYIKSFFVENYKFLIIWAVIIFLFFYELPFVIYTPGGVVNLEERIEISDGFEKDGSLNMSYVSLVKGTLPMILLSYFLPNWDLVKSSEITTDDTSVDELLELEKLYMQSSIDNATILAYKKAGKTIDIKKEINNIVYIADDANTNLEVYDELLTADGKTIQTVEDLKNIVESKNAGDTIKFTVNRNGKEKTCSAEIYNTEDGLKVGISFLTTYEYVTDPEIEVQTKSSESGSSGGLMLTLAIYNALIPEDITKGRTVVGTGTISLDGTVGAIDGVKYKILGAVKNDADIFLCPMENYEEAIKIKKDLDLDIKIHGVASFDEALNFLNN